MKGDFANFLGDGRQPHVPVGTLVFLWMFCQAKRLAIEVKNGLITLKNGFILVFFFHFILFIEYLLYLYGHNNPIKSETLY